MLAVLLLTSSTFSYVLSDRRDREAINDTSRSLQLTRRADEDPTHFGWIKRWAALGDSFTAGIGSGNLFSQQKGDYDCSRYDHSYVALANNAFGPSVEEFQYIACSGDKSVEIFEQVSKIKGTLDLIMLTAGGNDLCLV